MDRTHIIVTIVAVGLTLAATPALADHETVDCFDPSDDGVADARGEARVCVDIHDLEPFSPTVLIVDPGTNVTWRHQGDLLHTVTSTLSTSGESFDLGVGPHGNVSHVFEQSGATYYHCEVNAFHEATMHGAVIVG